MKKIIIIVSYLSVLTIGVFVGINYDVDKKSTVQKDYPLKTNKQDEVLIQKIYKNVLPKYISDDLEHFNINSSQLSKVQWQKFLSLYVLENSSKNSIPESQTIQQFSEKFLNSMFSSGYINMDALHYLISQGLDINALDETGVPIIYNYFRNGQNFNEKTMNSLVALGLDLYVEKDLGIIKHDLLSMALSIEEESTRSNAIEYLEQKGLVFDKHHLYYLDDSDLSNEYLKRILSNQNLDMNEYYDKNYRYVDLAINSLDDEFVTNLINSDKAEINLVKHNVNILFSGVDNTKLSEETYQLMIDKGADVNIQESEFYTSPLMAAVNAKNITLIKVLLENNADVSLQNSLEEDVFDFANKIQNSEIKAEITALLKKFQ